MKKICLITYKGTGSTLLTAFLNSHPDIEFFDEVFTRNPEWEFFKDYESIQRLDIFLDDFWKKEGFKDKKAIGFNIKYINLTEEIKDNVLKYLSDNNIAIIHLLRDPQRTFIRRIHRAKDNIDYWDFIQYLNMIEKEREEIRKRFSDKNYLELRYEDMTRGEQIEELPKDFEERILKWIGVDYKKLSLNKKYCRRELKIDFIG